MSLLGSGAMVHEFDLHASMFRMREIPIEEIRKSKEQRRVVEEVLRRKFQTADWRDVGIRLEIERANFERQGTSDADDQLEIARALYAILKSLADETAQAQEDLDWGDMQPEDVECVLALQDETVIALLSSFASELKRAEPVLGVLPSLAGLSGNAPCEVGGLRHSSFHGAFLKFTLQLRSQICSAVAVGIKPASSVGDVKKRARPQVGREQPTSTDELEIDDRTILKLWPDSAPHAGELASLVDLSVSHIRKRMRDFRNWGWISDANKPYELTEDGEDWVKSVRDRWPSS